MSKKILITGASGLIGTRLTELLLQKGYQVSHLGRTKKNGRIPSFVWDVEKGTMDTAALEGVQTIIHLAGAGIADKRWTTKRKSEILQSRVQSSALLYTTLQTSVHQVQSVVSASAIGYYGFGLGDKIFTETDHVGNDYLAQVTQQWEQSVDKIGTLNIRVAKLRVGIVLSNLGGALVEMAKPIKLYAGAPLGTGKQYLSWIHIDDLCRLFIKAIDDNEVKGAYNAVSGDWVSNKEFTTLLAKVLNRPLFLPHVPKFIMKLILGEMAMLVLNGSKVSADKIKEAGFIFDFPNLETALRNLLIKKMK
ncbi:MAG: TIGR01777 family oxidoreductase [Cytophagales bacterium]|nr:TIGR01777 family oxidoreductase [Cytophagales bacterium]